MRFLLDTNVLIWTVVAPDRIPPSVLGTLKAPENVVYFSVASIWEIAIKAALRREDFNVDPSRLAAAARLDFEELPVRNSAAVRVADLPLHHRDPFDRLLVAQAIDVEALLLTGDAAFSRYSPHVMMR